MMAKLSIHPFPGLRPFEANEDELFFGREGQSEEILRRLREHRFLALVGSSGSGKSSLIRAGLLPYLHGGFLGDAGSRWRVAIFRPGGNPIGNLAAALNDPAVLGQRTAPFLSPHEKTDSAADERAAEAEQDVMLLEVSLRRSGLGLVDTVRLARLPEHDQVLVVVDQFEELFRFAGATGKSGGEADAAAFVKLLLEASAQRELPIYVVITMRSDFIGDCARYRDLPEAVTGGLYLIPRMTRAQRRAAIIEPVRVGGGTIAPRLVVRLLNEVGDDPDQLPILQHALMRCWDYWSTQGGEGRPIDIDDYLAIGRMAEALSLHADEAFDGLPDDRFRGIARRMFQALTEKGSDNRETRRPTTIATLAEVTNAPVADIARIIEEFRRPGRSFLVPAVPVAVDRSTLIDISHESLIRNWQRLRQWVEEESESVKIYRRLAETAVLYERGTAGLWNDPDLTHALKWRAKEEPNAAWADRSYPGFDKAIAFLEKSRVARDSERRQRDFRRRRALVASLATAAVLGVFAVMAGLEWRSAQVQRDRARQGLDAVTNLARAMVIDIGQDFVEHGERDEANRLFDQAIRSFDRVIELSPSALAYSGRGAAYFEKSDFDRAIADFDQAIKVDPQYPNAYHNRGITHRVLGDYDAAMADFNQAIKLNPNYAVAYFDRGLLYFDEGEFAQAQVDLKKSNELNPQPVVTALWLYVIERRNHAPTELAQTAQRFDGKAWPAPVIRLFLGEASPAETLTAAETTGPINKTTQICEADFYVGEYDLADGAKDEALRLLRLADQNCPHMDDQWRAADSEVKTMEKGQ